LAEVRALATDYDGTLAFEGKVDPATVAALRRWRSSGRALVMVTGRELSQLIDVFPELGLFDAVVAENGALFWRPGEAEPTLLAAPPPPALVEGLRRRCIGPLSVGRSIVATPRECEDAFAETLAELGLSWRLIFNKDSLMCLPAGVSKATGLTYALGALGVAPPQTLGVGDAENDLDFLALCGVAAVVSNALPEMRERAHLVADGVASAGVRWLIERVLSAPAVSPRDAETALDPAAG
jgi:hypothetical protein